MNDLRNKLHCQCLLAFLLMIALSQPPLRVDPPVTDMAFSPNGKTVVTCSQAGLQVLSWPDMNRRRMIQCESSNLHDLIFSPDGKHLAVGGGEPSENGTIEVFYLAGMRVHSVVQRPPRLGFTPSAWIDNTRLVSGSGDREIKLWRLKKKNAVHTLQGHSRSVETICLLGDTQTIVSSGVDHSLRVWNLSSKKLTRQLDQHTEPVHALATSPSSDGLPMVASAGADRTIRFWQPSIGRMVRFVRLDAVPFLSLGSTTASTCLQDAPMARSS